MPNHSGLIKSSDENNQARGSGGLLNRPRREPPPPATSLEPDSLDLRINELQNKIARAEQQKQQKAVATIRKNMPTLTSDYFSSLTESRKREIVNSLLESYSDSSAPGTFNPLVPDETFPAEYIEEIRPRIKKIWGSKDLSFGQKMQEIKAIVEETPGTETEQSSTGGPLDETTAQQILQEAGGDKEVARNLAKQRGYTF